MIFQSSDEVMGNQSYNLTVTCFIVDNLYLCFGTLQLVSVILHCIFL